MNTLKIEIKKLAAEQAALKNQRKSVNIDGPRTMPQSEAAWKHTCNRSKLREMYIAYGLSKGKTYQQIESNPKDPYTPEQLTKIIERYAEAVRDN